MSAVKQKASSSADTEFFAVRLPLKNLARYERDSIDKRLRGHSLIYNHVLKRLQNGELKTRFDAKNAAANFPLKNNHLYLDSNTASWVGDRAYQAFKLFSKSNYRAKSQARKMKPTHPDRFNTVYGKEKKGLGVRFVTGERASRKTSPAAKVPSVDEIDSLKLCWPVTSPWLSSNYDRSYNKAKLKRNQLFLDIDWSELSQPRREYVVELIQRKALRHAGITRQIVRGQKRYYVNLVFKAAPFYFRDYQVAPAGRTIAIDVGAEKSVGVDSDGNVIMFKGDRRQFERMRAKRAIIDREINEIVQRDHPTFCENGSLKKGVRVELLPGLSDRAKHLLGVRNELFRKEAALKKEEAFKQARKIAEAYDVVVMEKVSYAGWKRRYKHSIFIFTPGAFQAILERELALRGRKLVLMPTHNFAFSQRCVCGWREKKQGNDYGTHICHHDSCPVQGRTFQRDTFSAFLTMIVHKLKLEKKFDLKENPFLPDDITTWGRKFYTGIPKKKRTQIEELIDRTYSAPTHQRLLNQV